MRTSVLLFLLVAAATTVLPAVARADEHACTDAFEQSQSLRDAGKLVGARKLLRVCAGPTCLPTQQKYCGQWLADVEARLPTLVVTAKDASGADVTDATVAVDGAQLASSLDGREIPVDPGLRDVVVQRADGTRAETKVLATERTKGKVVALTLAAPAPTPVPAPVPPVVAPAPAPAPASPPPPSAAPATSSSPPPSSSPSSSSGDQGKWRTVGWVMGAVGVVGIGVGAVAGFMAMNDNNSAQCNSADYCQPGPLSSARSAATISDIGFIGGGVLLVSGAAILLFGPSDAGQPAAALAPAMLAGGAGLTAGGRW